MNSAIGGLTTRIAVKSRRLTPHFGFLSNQFLLSSVVPLRHLHTASLARPVQSPFTTLCLVILEPAYSVKTRLVALIFNLKTP